MKKQRKHYTPEEKVAILRRHLLDKEPISKLCGELGLQPTVFYRWQKESFENGASAFEQKSRTTIQPWRNGSTIWRGRSRPEMRSNGPAGGDISSIAFAPSNTDAGKGSYRFRIGTWDIKDKTVTWDAIVTFRPENGKTAEEWVNRDELANRTIFR